MAAREFKGAFCPVSLTCRANISKRKAARPGPACGLKSLPKTDRAVRGGTQSKTSVRVPRQGRRRHCVILHAQEGRRNDDNMAKSTRRTKAPPTIDMNFDEALGGFAQSRPPASVPSLVEDGPVHLMEDDTGARFLIYVTDQGVRHELRHDNEQPWFTQKQLAEMFGVDLRTANHHVQEFMGTGELSEATIRNFRIVRDEGGRQVEREIKHYALDVAFYVGYRVNSTAGVLFRKWATSVLVRFATKGFVIDKDRLKDPDDPSIVDHLRDIVDEIRAAGANAYREVKKLCSACADYDGSSERAKAFFASMENKMLWVATADRRPMTSAELIFERADVTKPDMGLTYHTGKRGPPTQRDVTVGTNYLYPDEQQVKNRVINLVLRYLEDQHRQKRIVYMDSLETKLDEFIQFNGWPLLTHRGHKSGEKAREHAKQLLLVYKKRIEADE